MSKMTLEKCRGCRDDFYNGSNPLGVKRCWSFDKAQIVTRYRTHRDTMPGSKGAFTQVEVPNCYHGNGWYYCKELPTFVKLEDVINHSRRRRVEDQNGTGARCK